MEVMIETCCGIDVHQKSIVCCILDGPLDSNKLKKIHKKFGTTYCSFSQCFRLGGRKSRHTCFFESTGQYWLPLFNIVN